MGQGKNSKKNRNESQESEKKGDKAEKLEKEVEEKENSHLEEYGQVIPESNHKQRKIHLITIIGEVEGHENSSGSSKTIRYDHVLPELAEIEDDNSMDGLLVLLNTSGGDVDARPTVAEMITSLSLPTVSLVLGDSYSIGVPLAVSTNYPFIMPSETMMIHPVRVIGMVIGAAQVYEYFEMIQGRTLTSVASHTDIAYSQLRGLVHSIEMLTRDLGTVLVEEQAADIGLINRVGRIKEALRKLYGMIDERERRRWSPGDGSKNSDPVVSEQKHGGETGSMTRCMQGGTMKNLPLPTSVHLSFHDK